MTWLYLTAALVTLLGGLGTLAVRLRRVWRYVKSKLELLEELPWLVRQVKEHDQALIDAGLIRRRRFR